MNEKTKGNAWSPDIHVNFLGVLLTLLLTKVDENLYYMGINKRVRSSLSDSSMYRHT